jgi:hypothetical protein
VANGERRRRWDAGTVSITTRDIEVLCLIGDHHVVRQADLGELLTGVSERTVRGWLDRMVRAGLVHRSRAAGISWVQLTVAGGQQVDIPADPRRFSTWTADHSTTVLRLRLLLQRRFPDVVWRSERYWRQQLRELREAQGRKASIRVPDGSMEWHAGEHVAVEVEITQKKPDRYSPIVRDYAKEITEVWWYCPAGLVGWLEQALASALKPRKSILTGAEEQTPALERPHKVIALPEGVRP